MKTLTKQEAIEAMENGFKSFLEEDTTHIFFIENGIFKVLTPTNKVAGAQVKPEWFNSLPKIGWLIYEEKAAHTPLPWKEYIEPELSVSIFGTNNVLVADGLNGHNVALILRAVNSHHQIVDALKGILEACGTANFSSHNQMREAIENSIEIAEKALKNAEQ